MEKTDCSNEKSICNSLKARITKIITICPKFIPCFVCLDHNFLTQVKPRAKQLRIIAFVQMNFSLIAWKIFKIFLPALYKVQREGNVFQFVCPVHQRAGTPVLWAQFPIQSLVPCPFQGILLLTCNWSLVPCPFLEEGYPLSWSLTQGGRGGGIPVRS